MGDKKDNNEQKYIFNIEDRINDIYCSVLTRLGRLFPEEYELFERNIERELEQILNAYNDSREKALDFIIELKKGWNVFVEGHVYGNKTKAGRRQYNPQFGEEIIQLYDILHYDMEKSGDSNES
jgi:hypothetical protein